MTKDKITTLIGWSIFLLLFYFMGPSVAFMFGAFYLGGFYLSKVTEIKDQKVGIRYFILCFSFMFFAGMYYYRAIGIRSFERSVEEACLNIELELGPTSDAWRLCEHINRNLYKLHQSPFAGGDEY